MRQARPTLTLLAPFSGRLVALSDVSDPVYGQGIIGAGVALDPWPDAPDDDDPTSWRGPCVVHAPCDGAVTAYPHAVMLVAAPGRSVLVHLGVRAGTFPVQLLVRDGEHVRGGDPLLIWDPQRVRAAGADPLTPVVALQARAAEVALVTEVGQDVQTGQVVLLWS